MSNMRYVEPEFYGHTDYCTCANESAHDCLSCTEGCENCGNPENVCDDAICFECKLIKADLLMDQMKDGD
jgi:hypothetical protein